MIERDLALCILECFGVHSFSSLVCMTVTVFSPWGKKLVCKKALKEEFNTTSHKRIHKRWVFLILEQKLKCLERKRLLHVSRLIINELIQSQHWFLGCK